MATSPAELAAPPIEPAGTRMAQAQGSGRGRAQERGLPPALLPRPLRAVPVARPGGPKGPGRGDPPQWGPGGGREAARDRSALHEARNADYASLTDRYRKLGSAKRPRAAEELARLARELDRLADIDFFEAPGRQQALRAREAAERRATGPPKGGARPAGRLELEALQGRRWAPRPRPHVDRIASAWLIKRFLDPAAEFVFAAADELPADAIPFDMAGREFGHQGDHCTFETLLHRSGLRDRRLAAIAEIVHEADVRDGKFQREEARGLDLVLRGLLAAIKDDHEALAHGLTLFDGLYSTIGERP